ncbi:hypothetical protein HDU88_002026 [Geranomyces variabilis]|nr:hypothetical protein HDU88_002026 [Geranomyces variabilis]
MLPAGLFALLLWSLLAIVTYAYPQGSAICTADGPSIASARAMGPEVTPPTFKLFAAGNVSTYTAGGPSVTLTLNGDVGGTFKGLLLYAASTLDAQAHVGTWSGFDEAAYQTLDSANNAPAANCVAYGAGSTLSHRVADPKQFPANFTWTPPATVSGNTFKFFAAVVISAENGFQIVQSDATFTPA